MKKVAALSLLLLMTVNLTGFYGYFIVRMKEIHEEARASLRSLPETALQRFEFSAADFRRSRVEDDEIRVNGRMYDIARMHSDGTTVTVWALHDEAEDNLFSFINKVMDNAAGDDQQAPAAFSHFLSLQFISPSTALLPPGDSITLSHQTRWIAFSPQGLPGSAVQPPEAV